MQIYIEEELQKNLSSSSPLFEQMMILTGVKFRHQDGRLTKRLSLGQKTYFIKQHTGVGWIEIFKNLFQLRLPVLSAKNEWLAINKLQKIGLNLPTIAAYGVKGKNPATQKSFVLLEEIFPAVSLEDLTKDWLQHPPALKFKRQLIAEVARITRLLHMHGVNHRDLYICHFLWQNNQDISKIFLIDLHRAQIRKKVPLRWLIKDLACLYFSSQGIGITQHDLLYFIKHYRQQSLKNIFRAENKFWEKVETRGNTYRDRTR